MSIRKIYETTFIVNAALEDPDVEAVITKVTSHIESLGADIIQVNKWGRRRLAYPINKKYNGYYVHFIYEASPSSIPIFERFLVLEDTILRHLTLALPKKLKDLRLKMIAEGKTTGFATQEAAKPEEVTVDADHVIDSSITEEPANDNEIQTISTEN
jgi:small subunit ribosomal protein S6